MKIKAIVLALLATVGAVHADAKGMGFDVIYPMPISDPDNISDDGSFGTDILASFMGDHTSGTFNFNYQLFRPSKRSGVSLNFLYQNYNWSKGIADAVGNEMQIGMYYNRSLIRGKEDYSGLTQWRPADWNISSYFGLSLAQSDLKVEINNPGNLFIPVPELNGLRGGTNGKVKCTSFTLVIGLVGNYSFTKRQGLELFGNVDYHWAFNDTAFYSDYGFNFNMGGNYIIRLNPERYFPSELSLGLVMNALNNDIEDGPGMAVSLGYRCRF